jgi:acetyltransferase-like isoleucine patch superfamily enzyme
MAVHETAMVEHAVVGANVTVTDDVPAGTVLRG